MPVINIILSSTNYAWARLSTVILLGVFYWRMHSTWKCFFFPIFIIRKITSIGSLNDLFWKRHLHWQTTLNSTTVNIAWVALPFKDQKAADTIRRQLNDLWSKINVSFQPVFLSKKLEHELKITEKKPSIVNQQRVVYQFKCSFCDENYIGFTMRHLHERCEEHKFNSSSIKKHFNNQHDCLPDNINQHFTVLRKTKNDSLIYEMLYIRELPPSRNVQSDSIKAKLFV